MAKSESSASSVGRQVLGAPADLQMVDAAPSEQVPVADTVGQYRARVEETMRRRRAEAVRQNLRLSQFHSLEVTRELKRQAAEGVTGSDSTIGASQGSAGERDDDPVSAKRWKSSDEIGAIFEDQWGFCEAEVVNMLGGAEETTSISPRLMRRSGFAWRWQKSWFLLLCSRQLGGNWCQCET